MIAKTTKLSHCTAEKRRKSREITKTWKEFVVAVSRSVLGKFPLMRTDGRTGHNELQKFHFSMLSGTLRSSLRLSSLSLLKLSRNTLFAMPENGAKKPKIEVSPNTIGTHSGTFHCDEVLACYLLGQHPDFANHKGGLQLPIASS